MTTSPADAPQGDFDPYSAPADEDLAGRAVRLATACAVASQLLANPPSPLLAENLHDGTMTDMWPLRDDVSLTAAAELALAAHEPLTLQQADWDALICPGSPTRPVLSRLVPEAPAPAPEAAGGRSTTGHLALLPPDHAAVVVARTGSLATQAAASGAAIGTVAAFTATVRTMLVPLVPALAGVLAGSARSQAYRALAGLLTGIRDQAARLADDVEAARG